MAVISYREVIPRTFSHRFGEAPTAERKFVVTVDEPTAQQTVIAAVGIYHADSHPEYPYLRMLDASVSETDRQHVDLTFRYELPKQENLDPNPLARPDVWSFSTGGATVPAVRYYDGNNELKPLVNAAGDFFENITTEEAELRATISGNRNVFPLSVAAAVTNALNNGPYLGGNAYSWKCSGISAQQASEVVNEIEIRYWQITVELVYRASGWPLVIPDVGFNFLEGGQKKRCFVLQDGEKVASANAVALNANGAMKAAGELPDLLVRRVHDAVDFTTYFGTPPF